MSRPKKFNDYSYGVGLEYNASSYKQVKDAMKGDMDALLKLAKSYNEAIKIDLSIIPLVFIIFTTYSIFVYVYSFLRMLKQDLLREVVNAI